MNEALKCLDQPIFGKGGPGSGPHPGGGGGKHDGQALRDKVSALSHAAHASQKDEDFKAVAAASTAAANAFEAAGDRFAAEHYRTAAAEFANGNPRPAQYAQSKADAEAASAKANASGKPGDHQRALVAHQDAVTAALLTNNSKAANEHARQVEHHAQFKNSPRKLDDSGDLQKDDMKTANEQNSGIFEKHTLPLRKDEPVPGEGGGRVAGAKTDVDGGMRSMTSAAQLASGTAHAMSLKAGDPASQMAAAKAQVDAVSAWTDARKVAMRDGQTDIAEAAGMFASGHEILSRFHNALLND